MRGLWLSAGQPCPQGSCGMQGCPPFHTSQAFMAQPQANAALRKPLMGAKMGCPGQLGSWDRSPS